MELLPINEKLVWDYDIPPDAQENEAFREWYMARILTHGTADDIPTVGLATIHAYLPRLFLPRDIRDFWERYFTQPDVRVRYGDINPLSTAVVENNW